MANEDTQLVSRKSKFAPRTKKFTFPHCTNTPFLSRSVLLHHSSRLLKSSFKQTTTQEKNKREHEGKRSGLKSLGICIKN